METPADILEDGRWTDGPGYVRMTAGIKRDRLRALSCFRLAAHHLEVETMKWQRPQPPRHARLCGLCGQGVGDEWHMVIECPGYDAVRQHHGVLFDCLGGVDDLPTQGITPAQFRAFMLQEQWRVADFLFDCSRQRSANPPAHLVAPAQGAAQLSDSDMSQGDSDDN